MVRISRFLVVAAVMLLTVTTSSAQRITAPTSGDTPFIGSANLQASIALIQGATLLVKYGPLKASNAASTDDETYTADMSIKSIQGQPAVMTCNIQDKSQKKQGCNGSDQAMSHAISGEGRFDNEIVLNRDFLVDSQSGSGGNIAVDLLYI